MGDWGLGGGQRYEDFGLSTSTTLDTQITSGAANTKGSWTELIASTAFNATGIVVQISHGAAVNYLIDIGIGAGGSEVVLIPDIAVTPNTTGPSGHMRLLFPIALPAGTRIATRCQASTGSSLIRVSGYLLGGGFALPAPLGRVTAYGISTSTSRGTNVDPGGTAHTKGSYAELVASSANPIKALALTVGYVLQTSTNTGRWFLDLAIGAAGSEQVIIPNLYFIVHPEIDGFASMFAGPFPIEIAAGTRLAARVQSQLIATAERDLDLAVYGID